MGQEPTAKYYVDTLSDKVYLKIEGRANYTNCAPVSQFFKRMLDEELRREFVIDFGKCTGMDSTFLGILAGVAMDVKKKGGQGQITLCNLEDRNRELIQNLGLHNIMAIDPCEGSGGFDPDEASDLDYSQDTAADKKMVLDAHEKLIEADRKNYNKFQDVVAFLKQQIGDK